MTDINEQLEDEILNTEEENDDVPFVEFDISVSPSDPTLELLVSQIERGDIIIPFYQRKYVWKIEQASKLVESFLMGLPVPQIFLYINDDDILEVIDGQQRIMSIKYFFDGFFGEEDARGKKQVFKLKGLSEASDYNGKAFNELSLKDQRKLRNSTLRAINIKQLKPSTRSDSVFHIFERLNTGGTRLKPQEIRNAVYRGSIVDNLRELNKRSHWRTILGLNRQDKNQKDMEMILRLFSLYECWHEYEKPMLKYLNKRMAENKSFSSDRAKRFVQQFDIAIEKVTKTIDKPFRPRGVINVSVLEAVLITLMENPTVSIDVIGSRYDKLLENEDFKAVINGSTADTLILKKRLNLAREILVDGQ